jgi:hypothetical protein
MDKQKTSGSIPDTGQVTGRRKRYPLLNFLTHLIKLAALVPFGFGLLGAFTEAHDNPGVKLLFAAAGAVASLMLFTVSEVIRVLMDISSDSARILQELKAGRRN